MRAYALRAVTTSSNSASLHAWKFFWLLWLVISTMRVFRPGRRAQAFVTVIASRPIVLPAPELHVTPYEPGVARAKGPELPPASRLTVVASATGEAKERLTLPPVSFRNRTVEPATALADAGWKEHPRMPEVTATTNDVGGGAGVVVVVVAAVVMVVVSGGTATVVWTGAVNVVAGAVTTGVLRIVEGAEGATVTGTVEAAAGSVVAGDSGETAVVSKCGGDGVGPVAMGATPFEEEGAGAPLTMATPVGSPLPNTPARAAAPPATNSARTASTATLAGR